MIYNRYGWENPVTRSQREWERFDKEWRRKKDSPVYKFDLDLDKKTDHIYSSYRGYNDRLIYHIEREMFFDEEVDDYGSFNLFRSITVLPEHRQRGLSDWFIKMINTIADKHGCILLAFCCPYDIKNLDRLNTFETDRKKLKVLAEDFGKYCLYFDKPYTYTAKDKARRRRMRDRFVKNGWEGFNMNDKVEKSSKNKRWGFAYIPRTTNEELLKNIEWRRKEKQ